jgi:hypothetical protein
LTFVHSFFAPLLLCALLRWKYVSGICQGRFLYVNVTLLSWLLHIYYNKMLKMFEHYTPNRIMHEMFKASWQKCFSLKGTHQFLSVNEFRCYWFTVNLPKTWDKLIDRRSSIQTFYLPNIINHLCWFPFCRNMREFVITLFCTSSRLKQFFYFYIGYVDIIY